MFRAASTLRATAPLATPSTLRRALRVARVASRASSASAPPPPSAPASHANAADDERFMRLALAEAREAASNQEVPVGAVLVRHATGEVLAAHHNSVLVEEDPTAHAELKCIREGARALGTWRRLAETTLYVTLEPCPMCAGGILNARLGAVVWGAPNPLIGADGSWVNLLGDAASDDDDDDDGSGGGSSAESEEGGGRRSARLRGRRAAAFKPSLEIRRRVLEEECAETMRAFFRARREALKAERAAEREAEG